ncbi:MAG: ABC transporter substrate-binding protein [Rickettsiales bacterium]|nr:ABC transporter substrate-binding protein [Rickettsiales bacterium]
MFRRIFLGLLFFLIISCSFTKEIKVAVLKFGSVNWELDVISHHKLDKKYNINIKKLVMTNKDAATIAFLSKTADIFVTDWIWVSKQRAKKKPFTFLPYSTAAGGLLVESNSKIKSIRDLKGKNVGIAGGSLDKSWLFFRAYCIKEYEKDPLKFFKASFAAPPLINGLIINGELEGAINYWNYAARLEAKGFRKIIDIKEILPYLGINGDLPLIGYVFDENFEKTNPQIIDNFIQASLEARMILKSSDAEWTRIQSLTGAKEPKMLKKVRDSFRNGIPKNNFTEMKKNIEKAYSVLAEIGGKKLVGKSKELEKGTLWTKQIR